MTVHKPLDQPDTPTVLDVLQNIEDDETKRMKRYAFWYARATVLTAGAALIAVGFVVIIGVVMLAVTYEDADNTPVPSDQTWHAIFVLSCWVVGIYVVLIVLHGGLRILAKEHHRRGGPDIISEYDAAWKSIVSVVPFIGKKAEEVDKTVDSDEVQPDTTP